MHPLTIDIITREFAHLLSKEDIPKEKMNDYDVMQKHIDIRVTDEELEESLELFSDRLIKPCVAAIVNVLKTDKLILLHGISWELLSENCSVVKLGLDDSIIDIRGTEGIGFVDISQDNSNIKQYDVEHIMRFDVYCKEDK